MNSNTCENEQFILKALRNEEDFEESECIPNFVQSILEKLRSEFFKRFDVDANDSTISNKFKDIEKDYIITEDKILITPVEDYTIFKALGFDSHWCGGPEIKLIASDALKEKINQMEKELNKTHPNYHISVDGKINATNKITQWYVGPAIKDEETLRFFMNNLSWKEPDIKEIEKWKNSRKICMEKNFCQFISTNMVMEGGLGVSFALISKLMRKNPELLNEWYDFLMIGPKLRFKASVKAGFKLFCTADDMAYKMGPMISPENYWKFVVPRAKELCDIVRDIDGVIFMHTDGNIYNVIDCFIEAGYHAIQPLEPTSEMSIAKVKEKWGDKIACIGNCDTTNTLPFKSELEIRNEVRKDMKEGRLKGKRGYMFAASGTLHNRIPLDNVLIMLDEFKKINSGMVKI